MITDTRRTHLGRQEFLQAAAERLQQEWRDGHHIKSCPVFFNITNFHLYNAAHGFRQGDLCLQHIENILQEVFPCQLVVHLGSDTFAVLADTADVQVRIDTACQRVLAFIGNPNIALKAGIRFLTGLPSTKDLNVAFDSEAKIACDTIKKDASRHWAVYTEELGLRHQMQNYVREHLDQAMAKGYIRVYLQPVIRTLTGRLVSAEALARWESPQYGTISPGIFIPVLEEAHLIHKLDAYTSTPLPRWRAKSSMRTSLFSPSRSISHALTSCSRTRSPSPRRSAKNTACRSASSRSRSRKTRWSTEWTRY